MSGNAQYPPAAARRLPTSFLSLSPATNKPLQQQPLTADALAALPKKEDAALVETKRRTSSLSSDGSKSGFRFLRLGHNHQDDKKGDFFEVEVAVE